MTLPLYIFAVIGFAAVLWRLALASVRAARRGVDAFIANEMSKTRAERGDLTGMDEANEWARQAGRDRWRWGGEAVLWLACLIVPPMVLDSPAPVYAVYTLIWLLRPGGAPISPNPRTRRS